MGPPGLYYASLLGLRRRKLSHDQCSDTGCVANIVIDQYHTKHFSSECQFKLYASTCPLNEDPQTILKGADDKIPLIKVSDTANDLQLQVFPDGPTSKYVAISHV